jgi:hypothetical protein
MKHAIWPRWLATRISLTSKYMNLVKRELSSVYNWCKLDNSLEENIYILKQYVISIKRYIPP